MSTIVFTINFCVNMLFFKRVKSLVVADLLKKDLLKNVVAAFEEKRIQCGCFRMAIFV